MSRNTQDILNYFSHHAYLLIGGLDARDQILVALEKTHKLASQGNSDFFIRHFETMTIDDAREVKPLAASRPIGEAGKKIFILTMNGITVEAQNALLKLLEEPAEYAHFFLIIPSAHLLLPTVRSRMSMLNLNATPKCSVAEIDPEVLADARDFVKANQTKRLDMVKKLIDEISKEKKTKQDVIDFLNAVQEIIYKEKGIKEGKASLEAIEIARNYLNDRAPSVKMLLEYVALNI